MFLNNTTMTFTSANVQQLSSQEFSSLTLSFQSNTDSAGRSCTRMQVSEPDLGKF